MSGLSKSARSTIIVSTLLLVNVIYTVAKGSEEISRYIFKIRAECPWKEGKLKTVSGTGFKLANEKGIRTALHLVCGCSNIEVITQGPPSASYKNWKISQYDIIGDVALLTNTDDNKWKRLSGGLKVSSINPESLGSSFVKVFGFPFSVKSIGIRDEPIYVMTEHPVQSLENIIPSGGRFREALAARGSPSLTAEMLNLSGGLRPGHSGAPILDKNNGVVAVAIGGFLHFTPSGSFFGKDSIYLEADQYINWAYPLVKVKWEENDNLYKSLAQKSSMGFGHFSNYIYGHKIENVKTDAELKIYKRKGTAFKVFVDGVYLGYSNETLELPLESGTHTILLANPDQKKFIVRKATIYADQVNEFKIKNSFNYESDAFSITKLVRKENREVTVTTWLGIPIENTELKPVGGLTLSTSLYRNNQFVLSGKLLLPRTNYRFNYPTLVNFPEEEDYFKKVAPYVGIGFKYMVHPKRSRLSFYTEGLAALSNDKDIDLMSLYQLKGGITSRATLIGKWNMHFELGIMSMDFKSKSVEYNQFALEPISSFGKQNTTALLIGIGLTNLF